MFTLKPDYEQSKKRIDAFWQKEILDRPLVQFKLYKPGCERIEFPHSRHPNRQKEYLDPEYQAEWNLVDLSNQLFLGDSLPVACPNLGPAVMAGFYGCTLRFDESGAGWPDPEPNNNACRQDVQFDWHSPWLKITQEFTDTFLSFGKGKFITGMSNWLMAGDCLAAILGQLHLGEVLIDNPDWVIQQLNIIDLNFERLYSELHKTIRVAGLPITTWIPLVSDDKYYVVANDYSALVNASMYREIFLDDMKRTCKFLDHAIYHLDGPGALRHLDAILEVEDLDGVQFVPPPEDDGFERWIQLYKRIQEAGKCVLVSCDLSEVAEVTRHLKPEGLHLNVQDVTCEDEARAIIHLLEQWPTRGHSI
jgi:hypothetical protein